MKILMFPFGSAGDVHPFVGLAQALQARGHVVTVATTGYFRELVEQAGLEYVEQGTREEFLELTEHPDLWHPTRSFAHLFRAGVAQVMRRQYDLIAERSVRDQPLVINNLLGFGARIARDKLGVPLVTVHCQPACLWSDYDSPALAGMPFGSWAPRWLKQVYCWIGETFFIDRATCPETNRFRSELGLPPMRNTTRWWHSPDCVVCLFPEWYGPPQPDWPPNVHLTEFPLWDEDALTKPQPEVEEFLRTGSAPVVFTPGSANRQAAVFFRAAVDACRRLGRRGVLLSRFPEQIPPHLPGTMRHFEYVPFSRVLPGAAAIVHHGGIGTSAHGLRAGIPQLITPLAHDQPDNAARLKQLGVGDWLRPSAVNGPTVAAALHRLLDSADVTRRCQETAQRFIGVQPFARAIEVIEQSARDRGVESTIGATREAVARASTNRHTN